MPEYIFEISDALYNEETGETVMKPEYKGNLIRCKDCMFYQTDKGGWCLDHDDDVLWLEDSYCSRAVRKKYEFRK